MVLLLIKVDLWDNFSCMVEVNSFSIKINVDNWWHWFPNVPIKHFFLFCDYSHAFPHFSNQCKLFWSKMITSIAVTILHAIGESAGNICLVYNFEVCMNMNTVVTCKQLFNYLFILPGSSVHIHMYQVTWTTAHVGFRWNLI